MRDRPPAVWAAFLLHRPRRWLRDNFCHQAIARFDRRSLSDTAMFQQLPEGQLANQSYRQEYSADQTHDGPHAEKRRIPRTLGQARRECARIFILDV